MEVSGGARRRQFRIFGKRGGGGGGERRGDPDDHVRRRAVPLGPRRALRAPARARGMGRAVRFFRKRARRRDG
jgi:hypothetical protein